MTRLVLIYLASRETSGKVHYRKPELAMHFSTHYEAIKSAIKRLKAYGFIEQGASGQGRNAICEIVIVKKWRIEIKQLAKSGAIGKSESGAIGRLELPEQ
jgi:hypothetical protein